MAKEKNKSTAWWNEQKQIFRLAVRNLSRSKRRNIILAIAIAFGFFIVSSIDGLTTGAVENLEDEITQLAGGTVLIAGYEKIIDDSTGKQKNVNIIRDKDYISNLVESLPINYKYYSRKSTSSGQIVFAGNKIIGTLNGRDFEKETSLLESFQVINGSLDEIFSEDAIIITDKMAENLKISINDTLTYTCNTIYGQGNVVDFKVKAIVKGNSFFSGMVSYANIETVNKVIGIPEGGYTTFTIFLKNKDQQSKVAMMIENQIRNDGHNVSSRAEAMISNPTNIGRGIEKQFSNKDILWEGTKYCVETITDEVPQIQTILNIVHLVTTIILIVILLIVMIGISNTYRMVLYERIREIGTMRALGMSGHNTGKVFTTEAVILCIIGACAGLLLSIIVMILLGLPQINIESVSMFLHNRHISFSLSVGTIIFQYILMIILTSLAVRNSAKKAAHLSPAEALRTVK